MSEVPRCLCATATARYTRANTMRLSLFKPRHPRMNSDVAACVLVSVLVLGFSVLCTALIFFSFGMPLF